MLRHIVLNCLVLTACSDRHSRVNDGPLSDQNAISSAFSGGDKLSGVGREGLRVLIHPVFGRYTYYFALHRLPNSCTPRDRVGTNDLSAKQQCGPTRVFIRRTDKRNGSVSTTFFFLPVEESDEFFEILDVRLLAWKGTTERWKDGTDVSLERVRDGFTTSMNSNQPPFDDIANPAAQLRGDLLRITLGYGPAGFAPRSQTWTVRDVADRDDPCNFPGLAEPLKGGFGTGDSDCNADARWALKRSVPSNRSGDATPMNKEH